MLDAHTYEYAYTFIDNDRVLQMSRTWIIDNLTKNYAPTREVFGIV